VFDMADLASCSVCMAGALGDSALDAGYGAMPPFSPAAVPAKCQSAVAKAAKKLAEDWTRALARCVEFSGLGGCAAAGDIAGTQACVETAVADYAPGYTDVAYP
jgi:hypothetical protein